MNVALISPSKNSYSETFIQAQKDGLNGTVYYYYGGYKPTHLEGYGRLLSIFNKLYFKLKQKIGLSTFNIIEQAVITSLKKRDIDVVLAQYGPTGSKMTRLCEQLQIPLVVHFHGYDASKKKVIKVYEEGYKNMFKYASFIIAVSRVMVKDLIILGCPKEKIIYNPCAPNDVFYNIQPTFKNPQFITVGRFTEKKSPQLTISAFNNVVSKYKNAKLLMAGNGELLDECKLLVKQLDLEKNVRFLGVIKQEEFINYLEESLAFVQHSVTAKSGDKEGTPVAILEASAAGLPIIATFHAGIPDVIIHKKTGLLSKEYDVESMSKHMLQLLDEPDLAKKIGTKGKQYIKDNYNLNMHLDVLNNIIKQSVK